MNRQTMKLLAYGLPIFILLALIFTGMLKDMSWSMVTVVGVVLGAFAAAAERILSAAE